MGVTLMADGRQRMRLATAGAANGDQIVASLDSVAGGERGNPGRQNGRIVMLGHHREGRVERRLEPQGLGNASLRLSQTMLFVTPPKKAKARHCPPIQSGSAWLKLDTRPNLAGLAIL